ncbi:MAG: magnesium/cobalt transporter CorA [Bacteroidales bacterium]|nr:magnesium/cobalt transporter CorA [Bacteroidales bacterium]
MKVSKFRSPIAPSSLKKILKRSQPKISHKVGLPPGSIVYTGSPKEGKVGLMLWQYDEKSVESFESVDLNDILGKIDPEKISWLNFDSLHDVDLIVQAGESFSIHSLTLEDIVHVGHTPKMEEYDEYLFITLKMIKPNSEEEVFSVEQISFVLKGNFLLSFQEYKGDPFDNIRDRINTGKGKARGRGADYLLFLLIDAIVDQYLLSIETTDKQISNLELEIFENMNEQLVGKIIEQKKIISALRKIIYPVRDSLKEITTGETDFISEEYYNYYNDIYDHIKNIVEHLDSQREMLTSLMEFYMTQVSNQMNQVMKTLTVIATIFIPLTFLAGIYGMNFEFMPELKYRWAYPAVLVIMLAAGLGMYLYMRRKKWF